MFTKDEETILKEIINIIHTELKNVGLSTNKAAEIIHDYLASKKGKAILQEIFREVINEKKANS